MNEASWMDWHPIPGYETRYLASLCGQIFSLKTRRVMRSSNHKGYRKINLFSANGRKTLFVHRLVGLAWIKNPLNKPQINHKNGVKTDNRAENLEWCTMSENCLHRYRVLKIPHPCHYLTQGENNGMAKLTDEAVRAIRKDPRPQRVVGLTHGVSTSTVASVQHRRTWAHID